VIEWTGDPEADARQFVEGNEDHGNSPLRELMRTVDWVEAQGHTVGVVRGLPAGLARDLVDREREHGTEWAVGALAYHLARVRSQGLYPGGVDADMAATCERPPGRT
jgi:hypothetical protein